MKGGNGPGRWVMLCYQLPREPSTRRVALWRKLRRLGVAQLQDGLVAVPADARTREQFDWLAEEIEEAGGTAGVWLAFPSSAAEERRVATTMAAARAEEYRALCAAADHACALETAEERRRALSRLREQTRQINRRDFFPPPEREQARRSLGRLAELAVAADVAGEGVRGGAA